MSRIKVLFVCLGNICRSPTADGVFRKLVADAGLQDLIEIDSAGTAAWHVGKSPDPRTQDAAASRGYDLSGLRARQAVPEDFYKYDHILAMDLSNLENLQQIRPADASARLGLFLDYAPDLGIKEVPDPYYGGESGFEQVLDLVETAGKNLLVELILHHDS
ncbi:MAG: low molecular weight protein-tyrosine-phosphatase [Oceanospirillum sp.]|nr:low molecular weight protein-tyrosine-phosphatase [Oceanospirillum sp.]